MKLCFVFNIILFFLIYFTAMNCFVFRNILFRVFLVVYALNWQVTSKFPASKNYVLYHCLMKDFCNPGGDTVCGINYRTKIVALFLDRCTFHGANCFRMGKYWLFQIEKCNASIYFGEQLYHNGKKIPAYKVTKIEDKNDNSTNSTTTTTLMPRLMAFERFGDVDMNFSLRDL